MACNVETYLIKLVFLWLFVFVVAAVLRWLSQSLDTGSKPRTSPVTRSVPTVIVEVHDVHDLNR